MSKITLRQLRALDAVIQAGNANKAAENIAISQPALSQLISNLEHFSGLKLFDRNNRRLVPTEEAYLLNFYANEIFSGLNQIDQVASEIRSRARGKITLACSPALSGSFAASVLAPYLKERPNLEINLQSTRLHRSIDMLSRGRCDLGVILGKTAPSPELKTWKSYQLPMVCVMPPDHPLTAKKTITTQDFKDEPLVLLSTPNAFRDDVLAQRAEQETQSTGFFEANLGETVCAMIAQGLGIGVANPFLGELFSSTGAVEIRPMSPQYPMSIDLCTPSGGRESLIVNDLIDLFAAAIEDFLKAYPIEPK